MLNLKQPVKECFWCHRSRPFYEHGDWELDPDTGETVGWFCNHCLDHYLGWNEKRVFNRPTRKWSRQTHNEFVEEWNKEHPKLEEQLEKENEYGKNKGTI